MAEMKNNIVKGADPTGELRLSRLKGLLELMIQQCTDDGDPVIICLVKKLCTDLDTLIAIGIDSISEVRDLQAKIEALEKKGGKADRDDMA